MANLDLYFPKVLKWEGGFVNDPTDRGGVTNMGVTLTTWQQCGYDKNGDGIIDEADMRLLSKADAERVCRKYYWDRWRADEIHSQSVAECLVEWVWGSGKWGIVIPQRLLGLPEDGIVGPHTIQAVNAQEPAAFYKRLIDAKHCFIDGLCHNHPEQERFRKGWYNRINDFAFVA